MGGDGCREPLAPALRVGFAKELVECVADEADCLFSTTVGTWSVRRYKMVLHASTLHELGKDFGGETRAVIANEDAWEAVRQEEAAKGGDDGGSSVVFEGCTPDKVREAVYEDEEVALAFRHGAMEVNEKFCHGYIDGMPEGRCICSLAAIVPVELFL